MIKYLKTRWKTGVWALLMVAVTAGILFLYDIPLEPVGYVAVSHYFTKDITSSAKFSSFFSMPSPS